MVDIIAQSMWKCVCVLIDNCVMVLVHTIEEGI